MKIQMTGTHSLPVPELRKRIEDRIAHYEQRYPNANVREHYTWIDETHAKAHYKSGTGLVTISDHDFSVSMELPFFARPFKGKIEEFLKGEIAAITGAVG